MASQSLYRKWRSQTFDEVVGQENIIRTLKNALQDQKLAHAYLFTGPRGTGKTTTARLLAKTINCSNLQNGEPCNECVQCREITAGNSFNVIEIDAASNRGIDSIRELREKVMVPPSAGRYKVYILDEAHMLTTEAFNALLKTLEEPPPHAIFVMATTDVHKMLPTVLSRCQRFDFKRFTMRQIVEHLNFVAEQEQITLDSGAAELIARAAAGGMRDALSLLDQAIAYSGQTITLPQIQTMLGVADPRAIQKLITHIADTDSAAGLHLIHELTEAGADLRQINVQVAEYWRAMMLSRAGANIGEILDSTQDEISEIAQTAQRFALEELTECARIFAQNDLMQKGQGTPQLGLELALLACVEVHRRAQSSQPLATSLTRSQTLTPSQEAQRVIPSPPTTPQAPVRVQTPAAPTQSHAQPPAKTASTMPVIPTTPEPPTQISEEQFITETDWDATAELSNRDAGPTVQNGQHAPDISPPIEVNESGVENDPGVVTLTIQDVKEKWENIKRRVKTKKDGGKIVAFLNWYSVIGVEGSAELPVVLIKANAEFHYKALAQRSEYHEIIEWAMKVELQQECKMRLLPPGYSHGLTGPVNVPPPQPPGGHTGPAASMTMAAPPRPSAYRETTAPPTLPKAVGPTVTQPAKQAALAPPPEVTKIIPLARATIVSENSSRLSPSSEGESTHTIHEIRQAQWKKQSLDNQVVKRIAEMFKAEIKEIRPK